MNARQLGTIFAEISIDDDARVVEYVRLAKVYPGEDKGALDRPGCVVTIWTEAEMWLQRVAA